VRDVFVEAFSELEKSIPEYVYVYGETGFKNGGRFKPHKTHQNGLSVDLMIPVKNEKGESVKLPTNAFNRYGYDIDFTLEGKYGDLTLDYETFSALLVALKQSASNWGIGIWRVIFDPKMQHNLRDAKQWAEISDIQFTKKHSWLRHDDHFHIDFSVPCDPI